MSALACLACGVTLRRHHGDHCHAHGHQRGPLCPRCNALMGYIDRGKAPHVSVDLIRALIQHAARCSDCAPINMAELVVPTGLPPSGRNALNFTVEDGLKDDLAAYAARYGITVAAAARILLRDALDRASKNGDGR